ncbi:MAG: response regulator [Planctomycetes bacterium]|nr:response regulator [Planctomycetota bacterium]
MHLVSVREPAGTLKPGERAALKLIHPHLLDSTNALLRFLREARAGSRIVHPNVVRTRDVGTLLDGEDRIPYFAMDYVDGSDLATLMEETGRVPEHVCRRIGADIARGLSAIHGAGVVHRDLKPENILCTGSFEALIADFGVSRLRDDALLLSKTGEFVGSLLYSSPEQIRGDANPGDGRCDLYALGWILFLMASGVHPLARHRSPGATVHAQLHEVPPPLRTLNPSVGAEFEALVARLLAKDPADRLPTAAAVAGALEGTGRCAPIVLHGGTAPAATAAPPAARPSAGRAPTAVLGRVPAPPSGDGRPVATVLVVDDEEGVRGLLSRQLALIGCRPVEAAEGDAALGLLRSGGIDAVLLDLDMPGTGGLEVLGRMAADEALVRVPVVVVSGIADPEVAAACIEAGAEDFLVKPFSPAILRARLHSCLRRARGTPAAGTAVPRSVPA